MIDSMINFKCKYENLVSFSPLVSIRNEYK